MYDIVRPNVSVELNGMESIKVMMPTPQFLLLVFGCASFRNSCRKLCRCLDYSGKPSIGARVSERQFIDSVHPDDSGTFWSLPKLFQPYIFNNQIYICCPKLFQPYNFNSQNIQLLSQINFGKHIFGTKKVCYRYFGTNILLPQNIPGMCVIPNLLLKSQMGMFW